LAHKQEGDEDAEEELREILLNLRMIVVRRTVVSWERSQETSGEEIQALNDIDEAIWNNRTPRFTYKRQAKPR